MSADDYVEVKISRMKTLGLAILLAAILPIFSMWMYDGVRSEAAFQVLKEQASGGRRCVVCEMSYGGYKTLTLGIISAVNAVFGAAAILGLMRAFGPSTLMITGNGLWVYRFPGRISQTFTVETATLITVGRHGIAFRPAPVSSTTGKMIERLNIRLAWTATAPDKLANALKRLVPDWAVNTGK